MNALLADAAHSVHPQRGATHAFNLQWSRPRAGTG
jgi:hypothetical protein